LGFIYVSQIENGRVVFRVDNEFQVSLTVLGDGPNIPWRIIEIEVLVEDKDIGDGMSLAHPLQIHFIHQLAQSRLDCSNYPLKEIYDILHSFAQSLQLEVLYSQVLKLCRERMGEFISIEEYTVGRSLVLGYWK
jgi:mediator of RNA polymerase II transcription subunit 14